jgi:hypothetical protein
MYDETLANTSKQSTQQRGKRKEKREDPSPSSKDKIQSESQKGKRTNHVPKPPLVAQSIFKRKKDGQFERTISLEEASPTTTMCLKIETSFFELSAKLFPPFAEESTQNIQRRVTCALC